MMKSVPSLSMLAFKTMEEKGIPVNNTEDRKGSPTPVDRYVSFSDACSKGPVGGDVHRDLIDAIKSMSWEVRAVQPLFKHASSDYKELVLEAAEFIVKNDEFASVTVKRKAFDSLVLAINDKGVPVSSRERYRSLFDLTLDSVTSEIPPDTKTALMVLVHLTEHDRSHVISRLRLSDFKRSDVFIPLLEARSEEIRLAKKRGVYSDLVTVLNVLRTFTAMDLQNQDLDGLQLQSLKLVSTNFKGASMKNVNLAFTDLTNADLRHVNASGANFDYSDMIATKIDGMIRKDSLNWNTANHRQPSLQWHDRLLNMTHHESVDSV